MRKFTKNERLTQVEKKSMPRWLSQVQILKRIITNSEIIAAYDANICFCQKVLIGII